MRNPIINRMTLTLLKWLAVFFFSLLALPIAYAEQEAHSLKRWCEIEGNRLEALKAQIAQRQTLAKNLNDLITGRPALFTDLQLVFGFDIQDSKLVARRIDEITHYSPTNTVPLEQNCPSLRPEFAKTHSQLDTANQTLNAASLSFLQLPDQQRANYIKISEVGLKIQRQEDKLNEVESKYLARIEFSSEASQHAASTTLLKLKQWAIKLNAILHDLAILNFQANTGNSDALQAEIDRFFALLWSDTFSLEPLYAFPRQRSHTNNPEKNYLESMDQQLRTIESHLWYIQAELQFGIIQARKNWSIENYRLLDIFAQNTTAYTIESQALLFILTFPAKALATFLWTDPSSNAEKATIMLLHFWELCVMFGYVLLTIWLAKQLNRLFREAQNHLLKQTVQSGFKRLVLLIMGVLSPYFFILALFAFIIVGEKIDWLVSNPLLWLTNGILNLYLIYSLITVLSESMLIRVVDSAQKFVSGKMLKTVIEQSRSLATKLSLLMFSLLLINATIGKGYLYYVSFTVILGLLYLSIKTALSPQIDNISENIELFLAQRKIETDLSKRRMLIGIVSPLLLIPIITHHLVLKGHNELMFYGWYRKIFSHSLSLTDREDVSPDNESAHEAETHISYEKWFSDTNTPTELPHINTSLLTELSEKINRWIAADQPGKICFVSGEKGLGKSTTFKRIASQCTSGEIKSTLTYIDIPAKTTTIEDLTHVLEEHHVRIHESEENIELTIPRIIIIDNAQHLFLTAVGHLQAIEELLAIMRRCQSRIFWLIGVNDLAWNYIQRAMPDITCALDIIKTPRWTQAEIRSLILSRHHKSQFRLEYDNVALSPGKSDTHALRTAEQRFFYLLSDLCQGNPAVALRQWLKTVQVAAGRRVIAATPKRPPSPEVSSIPAAYMFVYASILIHQAMNAEELVKTTQLDPSTVDSALQLATEKGLLKHQEGRYTFHLIYLHFINNYLQRKNMLHE